MEIVVSFRNVTKIFRKFPGIKGVKAVDCLSFEIEKGEIFGLLGPNGSGKTTTIKMLLGMLLPSAGEICILGKTPGSFDVKHKTGFLPEASYLYPFLTGEETLEYYGRLARLDKAALKKSIGEVLEITGLKGSSRRLVREYSKGMGRRLQLAQVLLKDPQIFFMDEPTIGLDPIGSMEMKGIIKGLKDNGKTIILTSHLLSEVESICTRICILYDGRKITEGKIDDILKTEDEYQLIMKNIGNEQKLALKAFLEDQKITVIKEGHPRKRLDSLFVEEVARHRR